MTTDSKKAAFVLDDKLGLTNFKVMDNKTLRIYDQPISAVEVSRSLVLNDVGIEALGRKSISLEEYFLKLIHGGGYNE